MKKHLTLLLAVLMLAALLLSACAKTPVPPEKPPADTAEIAPEPEKAPADTAEAPEAEAEQPEEPEEESEEESEEDPEEAPQPVTFSVYYGDENAVMLLSEEVTVPELTPEAVVSELIRVGVLSEGTLVNRLELIAPYLYLDLSYEFLAKLQTMGSSGEMITVNSVVNTFLDAYGAELLLLSVNGSVIETGHTVYDLPLAKYENPEPAQEILLTVYRGNDNADAIIAEDVMVPEVTPEVIMEQLILAYHEGKQNSAVNGLLLTACVIVDFLCIHPFRDGNGRVSRLFTSLLLLQEGFDIGRYISVDKKINEYKYNYYQAF